MHIIYLRNFRRIYGNSNDDRFDISNYNHLHSSWASHCLYITLKKRVCLTLYDTVGFYNLRHRLIIFILFSSINIIQDWNTIFFLDASSFFTTHFRRKISAANAVIAHVQHLNLRFCIDCNKKKSIEWYLFKSEGHDQSKYNPIYKKVKVLT